MKNPIQTFEANTQGRDFIIGDLHGAYDLFLNLLEHLKFDGEVDRMFSVGDLVDRGPDSMNCLRLLHEHWFHCVLANHEQMMLEAFRGGYMGQFWFRNGGMWAHENWDNDRLAKRYVVNELDRVQRTPQTSELLDLIERVSELPFVITVNKTDGTKVHIVHAEIPPNIDVTDEDLANPEKVLELATIQTEDGDFFVWGRHRFYPFFRTDLSNQEKNIRVVQYNKLFARAGLSHVFSGHTIVQKPLTINGFTNLDTCAYGSYPDEHGHTRSWAGLTCVELNTGKFYRSTPTEVLEVEPVVINTTEELSKKEPS